MEIALMSFDLNIWDLNEMNAVLNVVVNLAHG